MGLPDGEGGSFISHASIFSVRRLLRTIGWAAAGRETTSVASQWEGQHKNATATVPPSSAELGRGGRGGGGEGLRQLGEKKKRLWGFNDR